MKRVDFCIPPVGSISYLVDEVVFSGTDEKTEAQWHEVTCSRPPRQPVTEANWIQFIWIIHAYRWPSICLFMWTHKNGVWAHLQVLCQMQRVQWSACSGRLGSSGETACQQAVLVLSYVTRAIIETGAKDHGRGELQVWDCAAGSPCCPLSRAKEILQLNDTQPPNFLPLNPIMWHSIVAKRGHHLSGIPHLFFSHPVISDSLWPHGLQHARPPFPSPSPEVYPSSWPLHWWCHPAISPSDALFSFCLQSFPGSGTCSNESAVRIRWPKYWSFSLSIRTSNEYSGLISLKTDWFDLLAVQRTLSSLLQHHSLKASILWCSAFFTVWLSQPCDHQEDCYLDYTDFCWQSNVSAF